MELSSSSDSEDCQLYTKAAINVEKRRKQFVVEREEFEKLISIVPEEDIDKVSKLGYRPSDEDLINISTSTVNSVNIVCSDSDDDVPLAELQKRLKRKSRSKSKHKSNCSVKVPKSSQKQHSRRCNRSSVVRLTENSSDSSEAESFNNDRPTRRQPMRNQSVIVLDDDTGYPTSFDPIDFNSRNKLKQRAKNTISEVSFNSIISTDSECDESFDTDNVVTLSIEWHNGKQCSRKEFKVRRYQKLEAVYDELAKEEGIPKRRVMLLRNFNLIKPSDTPSSLDLKYYGALTGSISKTDLNYDAELTKKSEELVLAEGEIVVKLQLETKQSIQVAIKKNHKLAIMYEKCSEELNCPMEKLKINFDGELVDPNEKPSDLDLEGGEIFHVYIKK